LVAVVKRKGEILDDDLARLIQRRDEAISNEVLERELISLEVQGIINVSQITKTRKKIKLVNQDRLNSDLFK